MKEKSLAQLVADDTIDTCFSDTDHTILLEKLEELEKATMYIPSLLPNTYNKFSVQICTEELIANAFQHSNAPKVKVHYAINNKQVTITVQGQASRFDPDEIADCCTTGGIHRLGGRGLTIIRTLSRELRYKTDGSCFQYTIRPAVTTPDMPPH